ncbi:MAG: cellulase family glycosylhydrolase [Prevotellaceae bacterium]|nr:cellulase family glycosylhydrolase [Prevotellaceae bacterium]
MWFGACSGENPEQAPELAISVETLDFAYTAETKTLHIKANTTWTITVSDAWCSVSPASGEGGGTTKVEISVLPNEAPAARNTALTVTVGALSKTVTVTQEKNTFLAVSPKSIAVSAEGEIISIEVQASDDFTVETSAAWITVGSYVDNKQNFTVTANNEVTSREGAITLTLSDLEETITVTQSGSELNITADKTGMERDAAALAAQMSMGWNLGNTLEVPGNETGWGNPKTTEAMIQMVKEAGINAIRLPCAWDSYLEDRTTYKIKASWLARIKEVVDYCVNNEVYAILNIHWDGGWLEENAIPEKQEEVNRKQKALWEQIAVYFRDYDEHLLFAGTNEVHSGDNAVKYYDVQMSYNQTFVNAVRSTGGRNTYRNLIVQSFATDIDEADAQMVMSTDPTPHRLMLEVHFYPWQFSLLTEDVNSTWGKALYLWGDGYIQYESISGLGGRASKDNNEAFVVAQLNKIKTKFVDNGYPAILGEYGAVRRSNLRGEALEKHLESRAYYMEFTTREAKKHGLVPFAWDTGTTSDSDYPMTIFNRRNLTVFDRQLLDAVLKGSREGVYPF